MLVSFSGDLFFPAVLSCGALHFILASSVAVIPYLSLIVYMITCISNRFQSTLVHYSEYVAVVREDSDVQHFDLSCDYVELTRITSVVIE